MVDHDLVDDILHPDDLEVAARIAGQVDGRGAAGARRHGSQFAVQEPLRGGRTLPVARVVRYGAHQRRPGAGPIDAVLCCLSCVADRRGEVEPGEAAAGGVPLAVHDGVGHGYIGGMRKGEGAVIAGHPHVFIIHRIEIVAPFVRQGVAAALGLVVVSQEIIGAKLVAHVDVHPRRAPPGDNPIGMAACDPHHVGAVGAAPAGVDAHGANLVRAV